MCITCKHPQKLQRTIHIRSVPDVFHRSLKARAANAGKSLSDYLLDELRQIADRPTLGEFRGRLHIRRSSQSLLNTARLLLEERAARQLSKSSNK